MQLLNAVFPMSFLMYWWCTDGEGEVPSHFKSTLINNPLEEVAMKTFPRRLFPSFPVSMTSIWSDNMKPEFIFLSQTKAPGKHPIANFLSTDYQFMALARPSYDQEASPSLSWSRTYHFVKLDFSLIRSSSICISDDHTILQARSHQPSRYMRFLEHLQALQKSNCRAFKIRAFKCASAVPLRLKLLVYWPLRPRKHYLPWSDRLLREVIAFMKNIFALRIWALVARP